MNYKEQLIDLYAQSSKHSNYQVLPKKLAEIIRQQDIKVTSRYERERFKYITDNIDFGKSEVLDIGGNTGFFTFELIEHGAKHIHYYDGNPVHSTFVQLAANILNYENRIKVTNQFYSFDNKLNQNYDIILLLNVLHHLGDDYGDRSITIERAKNLILAQLNSIAVNTSLLVFQLGFNWKGDRNLGLFPNGTKGEMIKFISNGTQHFWKIMKIGIAERVNQQIIYSDLNDNNSERNDSLGEFLNRPVFIMTSLKRAV
jgi:SAM-dependent methyltransferase